MAALPTLCFAALSCLLALGLWRQGHLVRAARARAADCAARADERGRRLGMLAGELSRSGMRSLTLAHEVPGEVGAALRDAAEALLCSADAVSDALAADAGPRRLREEPLPLSQLVEGALAAVGAPPGGGRHWRPDSALSGVTVLGDRRALTRALSAVLARAARESGRGDPIALRAVRAPDRFALVVEDEGSGNAPGDLADPAAGSGTRGLAPGLATARDLMRAHGGDLSLEAAAGIGARAWLTLPRDRVLRDAA